MTGRKKDSLRSLTSFFNNNRILLRTVLYVLTALEGLYTIYRLLQVSKDPQGEPEVVFYWSLLALAILLTFVLFYVAYFTWRWPKKTFFKGFEETFLRYQATLALLALVAIPLTYAIHHGLHSLYLGTNNALYRLAFLCLDPLLLWTGLAAIQWWVWLIFNRLKTLKNLWHAQRRTCLTALLIWGLFLLLAWIVNASGQRVPETSMTGWAIPSVPLLEWHIWLSILIAGLFFVLENRKRKYAPTDKSRLVSLLRSDRFWFFFIWGLSLILWATQPLIPNSYATPGRPPNFEVYPFSDGMFYDQTAQSILIGNGLMGNDIPARPLYTVFLAILHGLVGQNYHHVILVQTIVLAFFPAVLYLLGKEFGSRPAGIMMALLAILRDIHSIQAAPFTRSVANVKLYFSEVPTALGLSLFLLFTLRWLKHKESPGANSLLAGGMLGITMLIRTQSLAVLPCVLLFGLLVTWPSWKKYLLHSALLGLTLVVTIFPWLWRNYQITDAFVFDHPMSQTWEMANRYARVFEKDPWEILERQPGENDGEFTQRLARYTANAILDHPDYVFKTVSINLANGQLSSLLTLPIRPDAIRGWRELFRTQHAFWEAWPVKITLHIFLLLTVNMGLLALGISTAWRNLKWIGLLPLSMNVMYNLATAVFQVSGMRFVLPVTWVIHLYYALGILLLIEWLWKFLLVIKETTMARKTWKKPSTVNRPLKWPQAVLVLGMFALAGSSLILAEKVVPKRFPSQTQEQILAELVELPAVQQDAKLHSMLDNLPSEGGPLILKGRTLYPRYYAQDEVEPGTAKIPYASRFYPRVVFFFLSEDINQVVALPVSDVPQHLPHPSDIILIGCPQDLMIEARLVAQLDGTNVVYTSNLAPLDALCEE
jgi:hypothetical protein